MHISLEIKCGVELNTTLMEFVEIFLLFTAGNVTVIVPIDGLDAY